MAGLETRSLRLIPHTPECLRAMMEGVEAYAQCSGIQAASGLREFFVSGDVSPEWLAQLARATVADLWTHGFGLQHKTSQLMIGAAGYKGPPGTDGVVEIGYGVVSAYQNNGYATEAAQALTGYAFGTGRVRIVRAHTKAEANASTRVLIKGGFQRVGKVTDPEDGLVWRWEIARQ